MNYFAYPSMWGWLGVVFALWFSGAWLKRRRAKALGLLGQAATVERMLPAGLRKRRAWVARLQIGGLLCLTVALAGPLIGAKLVEYKQKGLDVFIAVDCSNSMLAEDFKPNRMAHARLILGQLIDRLTGSRIGIIAFAGQAYVQCPLTVDEGAAKDILETIDTGSVPMQGTVVGDAIRVAMKGLQAGEGHHRVLVLLTDGEDHQSDPQGAAKDATAIGLKIFPIGIGSSQGEPIPVTDAQGHRSGYKRDKKGEVVLSRMDETMLVELAKATDGHYLRASSTGDEVDELVRQLDTLQSGDQKSKLFNRFENRYQWPLALGLILLLASLAIPERPGERGQGKVTASNGKWLLIALLSPILFPLSPANAADHQLKEGNRQFKKGNYDKALELYQDGLIDAPFSSILQYNAGDATMMKGDFPKAEVSFMEAAKSSDPGLRGASHYNRGNALFYQGKWQEAIDAYKDSLRANPQDEDAKYNLGVAMKAKQNPPPPKSGSQGAKSQKSDSQKDKQKQDKNGQGQQNQPKPNQMSKEDAERLLSAAASGEKKKGNQQAAQGNGKNDEDW